MPGKIRRKTPDRSGSATLGTADQGDEEASMAAAAHRDHVENENTGFRFEVTVRVAADSRFDEDAATLHVELPGERAAFQLQARERDKSLGLSKELFVERGPYSTRDKAVSAAARLRDCLLVVGVRLGIGLSVSFEVTDERFPVLQFQMPYTPEASLGSFAGVLNEVAAACRGLTAKQALALELYGAFHFEQSARARFLTLVVAIESLSTSAGRCPEALSLVDSFLEAVDESTLLRKEKDSLKGSLQWLKQESIGKSCRDLVESRVGTQEYGGMRARKFFQRCYDTRSQIVHSGQSGRFLEPLNFWLERLVADVLVADIRASWSVGTGIGGDRAH